ncbi:hypothetical protein B484DRAFT_423077 [Ochromonadaceae sp. CCMP2298]|nr:hypothetical protein B484DRAFT_423077 [Ochromonadaceae sp. CCMP2298]
MDVVCVFDAHGQAHSTEWYVKLRLHSHLLPTILPSVLPSLDQASLSVLGLREEAQPLPQLHVQQHQEKQQQQQQQQPVPSSCAGSVAGPGPGSGSGPPQTQAQGQDQQPQTQALPEEQAQGQGQGQVWGSTGAFPSASRDAIAAAATRDHAQMLGLGLGLDMGQGTGVGQTQGQTSTPHTPTHPPDPHPPVLVYVNSLLCPVTAHLHSHYVHFHDSPLPPSRTPSPRLLGLMGLQLGANEIVCCLAGGSKRFTVWVYAPSAKLVVMDIDGTITKSDISGYIQTVYLGMFG